MKPKRTRQAASLLAAALLLTPALFAFDAALSDQAVREAYFLGQRHDGSFARLLDKYSKHLPAPKSGPYVRSITFLTPFAKLVHFSDAFTGNYSAQQAALDHRAHPETVEITVEILLTDSYGPIIADPASPRSDRPQTYQLRSHDFWKDFQVEVFEGEETRAPAHFNGEPTVQCSRYGYNCNLIGATLHLEFPATAFNSDSATVHVIPPEGPEAWVDFDLTALR
jgi:hypothetical protein